MAVREHIDQVLGEGYMFPLLGKWKSFEEIDFSKLPNAFVLKCNHDSGSTKVIRDKGALAQEDYAQLRQFYERRLSKDFYFAGREYPYKGLPRYIIAEQLMVDEKEPEKSIEDYKFFCFNGEPKIMFVVTERGKNSKLDYFDMDFNHLPITDDFANAGKPIDKPANFQQMKEIAALLSKGKRHVRIDLYELNGKIYFGEYTFFHGGGFQRMKPEEWEIQVGDWIDIT